MNSKFIHVERIIRKINYLYETIEANSLQSTNLEIALLRQYAVDLYDSILAMEAEQSDELNISKQVMEDLRSERARVADQMRVDVGIADLAEEDQDIQPDVVKEEESLVRPVSPVSPVISEESVDLEPEMEQEEIDESEAELEAELEAEEDRILDKEILAAAIGAGGALSMTSLLGQDADAADSENQDPEATEVLGELIQKEAIQSEEVPEPESESEPEFVVEEAPPEMDDLPDFNADTIHFSDDKETEMMPEGLLSTLSSNGISTGDSLEDEARTEVLTDLVAKLREKENAAESLMREAVEEPLAVEDTPPAPPPIVEEFLADPEPEPSTEMGLEEETTVNLEPESLNELLSQQNENKPLGESLSYNSGNRFGINFNQRYSYIENLFDDNANEYDGTIAELSKCSNVIEAFTYLNLNVKNKYRWRKDDPISEEFLNQIKETFLSED